MEAVEQARQLAAAAVAAGTLVGVGIASALPSLRRLIEHLRTQSDREREFYLCSLSAIAWRSTSHKAARYTAVRAQPELASKRSRRRKSARAWLLSSDECAMENDRIVRTASSASENACSGSSISCPPCRQADSTPTEPLRFSAFVGTIDEFIAAGGLSDPQA